MGRGSNYEFGGCSGAAVAVVLKYGDKGENRQKGGESWGNGMSCAVEQAGITVTGVSDICSSRDVD